MSPDQFKTLEFHPSILRFSNIGHIFRFLELLFALLFFSWSVFRSSPYFAAVFHLSGLFLRHLSILAVNHHFVFLLGNGIIVTLFVKFASDTNAIPTPSSSDDDENDADFQICQVVPPPFEISSLDAVPKEEKRIIPAEPEPEPEVRKEALAVRREPEVKKYRRSRSSGSDRKMKPEKIQLRRSETEPRRNSVTETAPVAMKFDDLSNEEFRQKIESVIEQHRRSLRRESQFMIPV